ncbi:MAG: hypothetical protein JW844_02960 [Candidatus Omnitrophica bacterium]|nr:hypothetical protein [Candidatus Omnitrophota bacterium]
MLPQNVEIGWQDYLQIFMRRKWFFIMPVILVVVAAIVISGTLPKIYSAQTIMMVVEEKTENPMMQGLSASTTIGQRMNNIKEELLSWRSMVQLVKQVKLLPEDVNPLTLENYINRELRKNLEIRSRGGNVVTVSFEGKDPAKTQEIVNSITDIFIQQNQTTQIEESEDAIVFIEQELGVYKQNLENAEDKLRKFKEVYSLDMPKMNAINKELESLELRLTALLIDNTEEHPAVIQTRKQIESLKEKRNHEIALAAEMANLDINPEMYEQIAESIPRQEQELARLTRDYQVNEGLYTSLLGRLEKARITQRLEKSDKGTEYKLLEPARLPLKPIKPNRAKLALYGLALGIFLGIGCVISAEYLDHSFRDAEEAKYFLELPILGVVSSILVPEDYESRRKKVRKLMVQVGVFVICLIVGGIVSLGLTVFMR